MAARMEILQTRGEHPETRHRARAVAVRDGAIVWASGPPTLSPWRSAAKPFQLWCSLEILGDPELSAIDLALGASSHSGQPDHVAALRDLMARLGVEEGALRCGAEPPWHRASWEALIRAGEPALEVHNDCSGKHSFFAAATRARGWPDDYREPDHPLQRRVTAFAAERAGEPMGLAVDGCGVPVLCLSVAGMARAWAWLAEAMQGADPWTGQQGASTDPGLARAARIGWAMAHNPWWTSGDDRLDLEIARGAREPLVGKIGAGGVFCLALPERRLGVAVKVLSGDESALGVAVAEALARAAPGAWSPPEGWDRPVVRNVVGRKVGERVVIHEARA